MEQNTFLSLTLKHFVIIGIIIALVSGCSMTPKVMDPVIPPERPAGEIVTNDAPHLIDVYDPLGGFNRRMYFFNAKFDRYVFLPLVNAYTSVTPDIVQTGVSNFFSNLDEFKTLASSLLQAKGRKAATTTARIVINTTIGIGGLLDPATAWSIIRKEEDFGQTLGFYHVPPGPYLVLPLVGPSTVRDAFGLVFDRTIYNAGVNALINGADLHSRDEDILRTTLIVLEAVDRRYRLDFRYYQTGSPFEYELVRLLYLEKRSLDIQK
nr:VacJ family lipoprotein [Deltaproteobacteria bacterium]